MRKHELIEARRLATIAKRDAAADVVRRHEEAGLAANSKALQALAGEFHLLKQRENELQAARQALLAARDVELQETEREHKLKIAAIG